MSDSESLEAIVARHFQCTRCRHTDCVIKRVTAMTDVSERLYSDQKQRYLSVACQSCGLTDLYDLDVLESPNSVPGAYLYKSS